MKQAIAGVAPADVSEVTTMVVWPSIAAYPTGPFLGRLYSKQWGISVVTVGNLLALASIPHALALYVFRLAPSMFGSSVHGTSYRLTNRRVIELRNEVRLGPGTRLARVGGAATLLLASAIGLAVVKWAFGWPLWPSHQADWIVTIVAGLGIVLGLIPLAAEAVGTPLPVPCFTFGVETKSVRLDRFDTIQIARQPGQEWFDAGDLVFLQNGIETFRLAGVSRPEGFRQTCLKSQQSFVGVKRALELERQPLPV